MDIQLSAAEIGSTSMSGGLQAVVVGTAVGCGVAAGAFFTFSSFVMPALNRLPAPRAVAAMQSINRLAVRPLFMTAVFGTALACLAVTAWAALEWHAPAARWVLAGGLAYVIGAIVVTIAANVPLTTRWTRRIRRGPPRPATGLASHGPGVPGITCAASPPPRRRGCSPWAWR
jgi:uncharacterized membrane protein